MMCKFCNGAKSMRAKPYMETIEDVDVWRLPQRKLITTEKMPQAYIIRESGCYFQNFYKKPFSFCPYCGRQLQERRNDKQRVFAKPNN